MSDEMQAAAPRPAPEPGPEPGSGRADPMAAIAKEPYRWDFFQALRAH